MIFSEGILQTPVNQPLECQKTFFDFNSYSDTYEAEDEEYWFQNPFFLIHSGPRQPEEAQRHLPAAPRWPFCAVV